MFKLEKLALSKNLKKRLNAEFQGDEFMRIGELFSLPVEGICRLDNVNDSIMFVAVVTEDGRQLFLGDRDEVRKFLKRKLREG